MYSTETMLQGEVVGAGSHGGIPEGQVRGSLGGEQESAHNIRLELVVDDLMRGEKGRGGFLRVSTLSHVANARVVLPQTTHKTSDLLPPCSSLVSVAAVTVVTAWGKQHSPVIRGTYFPENFTRLQYN